MPGRLSVRSLIVAVLALASMAAQNRSGELRLEVRDAAGLPLESRGELVNQASQVRQEFVTDRGGNYTAKGLPFGIYVLTLHHEGFTPQVERVEIRSEVPFNYRAVLGVAPIETTVRVTASDTLLDPHGTGSPYSIGAKALDERHAIAPGRSAIELVQSEPGWLLEANGVLHPRGAEYDTQYVIDGVPILDNRSPAFAPSIDTEELRSMTVLTAGYPAEYGRKLGGVVEVATERDDRPGFHWKASLAGGSFDTQEGFLSGQYTRGRVTGSLAAEGSRTSRFLDPPVEQNYSNRMNGGGVMARLEADLSDRDRVRGYVHSRRAGFLVPNELVQQEAGQRQDRASTETMGQISYQRVISPRALASVRAMGRDLGASLWSNSMATPIAADQQRGFREAYTSGSLAYSPRNHELKFGGDALFLSLHEGFDYHITDPAQFDPEIPHAFRFFSRAQGREQSLFAQDVIRLGRWTVSAGLRWDHYRILVGDSAFSPRLGVAWYWPSAGLVLRASYDRAFEVPAIENLLLASSRAAQTLTSQTTGLPVPPSNGDFYQAGFAKSFFGRWRLTANWYRREIRNFADDDLLLNTGVSFPIAFAGASIHGYEAKLELPAWRRFSGFLSYANLVGTGRLPITGGLFLDAESTSLLQSNDRFPITQDQRNTASARVRYQVISRLWVAASAAYGSGLPIEIDNVDLDALRAAYSPRILARVNFVRGRVRPSFTLKAAAGLTLWSHDRASTRLGVEADNLTDRLNVINFAGLFSGTALAAPRSFSVRLATEF